MYRKQMLPIVLFVLALLSYQETFAQGSKPIVDSFTVAGSTVIIRYPHDPTAQQSVQDIKQATQDTLPIYQSLFDKQPIPPLFFDLQTTTDPNQSDGTTVHDTLPVPRTDGQSDDTRDVCQINMYIHSDSESKNFRFVIAHELAHCFQLYYIRNEDQKNDGWWIEGGAQWLASQVYPIENDASNEDFQAAFISHLCTPMFSMTYEGYFLWEYIAERFGPQQAATWMQALPPDNAAQAQSITQLDKDMNHFFQDFGIKVASGQVQHMPDPATLRQHEEAASTLPTTISVTVPQDSICIVDVNVGDAGNSGPFQLTTQNLTSNGILASLVDGTALTDGNLISGTANNGIIRLVLTHADMAGDGKGTVTISTP